MADPVKTLVESDGRIWLQNTFGEVGTLKSLGEAHHAEPIH